MRLRFDRAGRDDALSDADAVAKAVAALRAGNVVAIPTETVYGLAADAANEAALAQIFAIKGRPAGHPLILHVANAAAARSYARDVPPGFDRLAERFWPGPLTIVVPAHRRVSAQITGGQSTVAIRVPSHPLARAILASFGGAVAAPSANRFGRISPTSAQHVRDDLGDALLIVDGGPSAVGLESTIVDLTAPVPAVLRTGVITLSEIAAALSVPVTVGGSGRPRVSGGLASHYAPRAQVVIRPDDAARDAEVAARRAAGEAAVALAIPPDPSVAARSLYAALRALDADGAGTIVVTAPPAGERFAALADRLARAAAPRD